MSHHRMSASSVAHKSTGETLQLLPEPIRAKGQLLPDFCSDAIGLSGRFNEGFSRRRLH
jgi:hypothetical protein